MARRPSARRLMNHAAATGNMELMSLLIIAGGLEVLHSQQAHQPATIAERVQRIKELATAAVTPATPPQPVRA